LENQNKLNKFKIKKNNMKPLFFISAPIDTFSGYGARSRDIVKALLKSDKYDIKILPQRWGSTPFGFLNSENPEHKQILDCCWNQPQIPRQPDIWMQITVPNEFQAIGKFNIGMTAGIETTICDPSWLEGLNRMNLNLVSSEHAKNVFESSVFEQRDKNQGNQVVGTIKLEKPIEVLFEGADTNIYQKLDAVAGDSEVNDVLNSIDEDFNFLFVGHWLQGELGQDRKDVGMLIKTFLETFKGKSKKPGLILKTSSATYSIMDRDDMLDRIQKIREFVGDNDLPNIYLFHGELEDGEINELYNHSKVKAHVSFTKGEGYGRPLLEASISQKPVIASNYSGHIDFLDNEMSVLLPGQVTQIHPSAVVQNMLIPESGWFTVDYKKAAEILEDVYKNYNKYIDRAKRQSYRSRTEFSLDKMSEKLISILEKIPKPIQLKLPQLKKIELPKLKKID
jgi:glycosyltransferase involved in cell wall biosynthesis